MTGKKPLLALCALALALFTSSCHIAVIGTYPAPPSQAGMGALKLQYDTFAPVPREPDPSPVVASEFVNSSTPSSAALPSDFGVTKFGAALSPDRSRILFCVDLAAADNPAGQVGIMQADGSNERYFTIGNAGTGQVLRVAWLDNVRFMAEYHVNPSTNQVFVVDSETGETLASYAGTQFQILSGGRILYVANVPHGFSDEAFYSVAVDGETLYTSLDKGKPIIELFVFANGTKLAVLEGYRERDKAEPALTVGVLDGNAFTVLTRNALPEGNWRLGEDGAGHLRVTDGKTAYTLDESGRLRAE